MQEIGHWINGKMVKGTSGRFADVMNPATGEVQARVALATLGELGTPLDRFFNDVMVMSEDAALRDNRLALLSVLQQAFAQIADLALVVETE